MSLSQTLTAAVQSQKVAHYRQPRLLSRSLPLRLACIRVHASQLHRFRVMRAHLLHSRKHRQDSVLLRRLDGLITATFTSMTCVHNFHHHLSSVIIVVVERPFILLRNGTRTNHLLENPTLKISAPFLSLDKQEGHPLLTATPFRFRFPLLIAIAKLMNLLGADSRASPHRRTTTHLILHLLHPISSIQNDQSRNVPRSARDTQKHPLHPAPTLFGRSTETSADTGGILVTLSTSMLPPNIRLQDPYREVGG